MARLSAGLLAVAAISSLVSTNARRTAAQGAATEAVAAFEAATIKRTTAIDAETSSMVMPGGRYVATNMTLRGLLGRAYSVQQIQIVGGPAWLDTERFDVLATANVNVSAGTFREQFRPLLATLLRDRFKVSLHNGTRELPAFALVVARRDGRLGPQLRPTTCVPPGFAQQPGQPIPQISDGSAPCGGWYSQPGRLYGRADFGRLVDTLAQLVDRVLVDRTSLIGRFEWDLQWVPSPLSAHTTTDAGPSLFTALVEQLGLKLDAQRLAVDVRVIDHAEPPAEN